MKPITTCRTPWTIQNRAHNIIDIKGPQANTIAIVEVDAHHPDYAKPLEVVWLCRTCHRIEHAKSEGK